LPQERFYHVPQEAPQYPACAQCGGTLTLLERSNEGGRFTSVFPFTTTHIDAKGRPITVESMGHLRKLEKEYGVVLSAFSNEVNNSVDGIKGDLPRYRGWLSERQRHSEWQP